MIALSTSWYSTERIDVKKMLEQVLSTGVSGIEIGYNLTSPQLKELQQALHNTSLKVVSVHNYSPVPDPVKGRFFTDLYRISSLDEHERSKAVEYSKRTIDTARQFGAGVIVVHAGTVESVTEQSRELYKLYRQGAGSELFTKSRDAFMQLRAVESKRYLENTVRSLDEITTYAVANGVLIGLETRFYPNEIPNFEEIRYLLGLFGGQGLRYWHDVGHAEVTSRLGLADHLAFLREYAHHLIGFHLHDVIDLHDHLAPFTGSVDYSLLQPYLKKDVLKVIEAHSPATVEQIQKAVEFLTHF